MPSGPGNYPGRYELYVLGAGEEKVTWIEDPRTANTVIFKLNKEDHTLGNLLSSRLRNLPGVTLSSYKCPHPLEPHVEMRVTTDGTKTPQDAVYEACKQIVAHLHLVAQEFIKEMELLKITKAGQGI